MVPLSFFRERPWALFLLVAWACIIFVLSSFPGSSVRYEMPLLIYFERKGAHVFEFLVLSAFAYNTLRAFFPKDNFGFSVGLSAAFALAYAFLDEAHQSFVPFREGKLSDVGIDLIGIALFVVGYIFWKRYRKSSE
jgi:VanZ family protein